MRLRAFAMLLLAGCAAHPPTAQPVGDLPGTEFLEDGRTTRESVLLALGAPTSAFENDRILLFRLAPVDGRYVPAYAEFEVQPLGRAARSGARTLVPPPLRVWCRASLSLVVVFDIDGILLRHKTVRVR